MRYVVVEPNWEVVALLLTSRGVGTSVPGADIRELNVEVLVLVRVVETVLALGVPVLFGAIFSA